MKKCKKCLIITAYFFGDYCSYCLVYASFRFSNLNPERPFCF